MHINFINSKEPAIAGRTAQTMKRVQQQLAVEFAFSLFSTQFKNENHQRQTATGQGSQAEGSRLAGVPYYDSHKNKSQDLQFLSSLTDN